MKIGYSPNINVKELKEIIQTLSKTFPEDVDTKQYLTEFNNIKNTSQTLQFLNKRLLDYIPRDRNIKYSNGDSSFSDSSGNTLDNGSIDIALYSYLGNWNNEYDTSGWNWQYKTALIPYGYFTIKLNKNAVTTSGGEYYNSVWLGNIDEGNTYNATELDGTLPCRVYNNNINKLGFIRFEEQSIYLYLDSWDFLNATDTVIRLSFNGVLYYKSYEDYTPKTSEPQ